MRPNAFSSPILAENVAHFSKDPILRGEIAAHFQNALYAIQYHLEQALPKGGVVCALYPKSILEHILPEAAKKKGCKVIALHGTKGATLALLKAQVLENNTDISKADIYITEPAGFTPGGALTNPDETKLVENSNVLAVGSALQWTNNTPSTHDFAPISKTITELGIYSPEHFKEIISRAFSWPAPLTPSPA